jgi:putative membrane protein
MPLTKLHWGLLATVLAALGLSAISPYDRLTWVLEVAPVFIGLAVLLATWRRFPLTSLLCLLITIHALILIYGGQYTYARTPFGFWLQDLFDFARNPYDRIGHLAQGFVPAILAREILLRRTPLLPGGWLFTLVTCVCLAFSAFYELIEWWAALAVGGSAEDFLALQGDEWDTQADMFMALIGAMAAQLLLARTHDRQLAGLKG